MSKASLHFRKIKIVRAPGFESAGFTVSDLSRGINIVHGPNASGKTTLARSVQDLLWPSEAPENALLVGHFEYAGEKWRVDVEARRPRYQRDGSDVDGPSLPPIDHRGRYNLALHDLLQHETRNQSLAEAIQRESIGGYDLHAAPEALGLKDSPSSAQTSVAKEAATAVRNWEEARAGVEALRGREAQLVGLRQELGKASAARRRSELLRLAISFAEAHEEAAEVQAKLDDLPEVLSDMTGDEAEEARELENAINQKQLERESAIQQKVEAEKGLVNAELPGEGVPQEVLDELKELHVDLKSLEEAKRQHEQNLAGAGARREAARKDIGESVSEENLQGLPSVAWGEANQFAEKALRARAQREQRDALKHWLKPEEESVTSPDEIDALGRGRHALEGWLQEPIPTSTGNWPVLILSVLGSLLAVGLSVALGISTAPAFYFLSIGAIPILGYGLFSFWLSTSEADSRQPYREQYRRSGLVEPDSWTPEDVRSQLDRIYADIAHQQLQREKMARWDDRKADMDELNRLLAEVEDEHSDLVKRFGVVPDTTGLELFALANAIHRWQVAHADVLDLEAKLEETVSQLVSRKEALNRRLTIYGYEPVETAAEGARCIRNLESRERIHNVIVTADRAIAEFEKKRRGIYERHGLEVGNISRLSELCAMRPTYIERSGAARDSQTLLSDRRRKLGQHTDFVEQILERSLADLRSSLEQEEENAAQYEEIRDKVRDIESEICRAKSEHVIEDSLATKERALDALVQQLKRDYARMVGHQLIRHLEAEAEDMGRPEVFSRAREILSTVTRGRYRLDLEEGTATSFRAYDSVREVGCSLDELSSATRLQLLLSVRIAFIERQEQGAHLPLLLDETLANTDDTKAQAIIESVIELAREGRQVFYFTAQGDEVAKWSAAFANVDDVPCSFIDLAEAQGLSDHIEIPDLGASIAPFPSPPNPAGLDHKAYGDKLNPPRFDPRQPAGAVHLWYVVCDPKTLHDFLRLGVETWGQLKALIASDQIGALVSDTQNLIEESSQNGQAIERLIHWWRIGRGKPVDRKALEESGAISETHIEKAAELAAQKNGDAQEILNALRDGAISRFHDSKKKDLETYFVQNGYIDSAEALSPEEIRLHVVQELIQMGLPPDASAKRAGELFRTLAKSCRRAGPIISQKEQQ